MKKVQVNDVELHYVDYGDGVAVVFVHGALEDLRTWEPHAIALSDRYRTITYSRRHNYPNQPVSPRSDHSAISEAEDLAGLIRNLKLGSVHVVGASYGAYTALFLAIKHPHLVRSLVLSEAPVVSWLPELPHGAAEYDHLMRNWWHPAAEAFRRGDPEEALRITFLWWGVPWTEVPENLRDTFLQNQDDLRAMVTSSDAFPGPARDGVRQVAASTLMLSGAQTIPLHRIIDDALERTLPNCTRAVIDSAGHDMWHDQPDRCRALAEEFFERPTGAER